MVYKSKVKTNPLNPGPYSYLLIPKSGTNINARGDHHHLKRTPSYFGCGKYSCGYIEYTLWWLGLHFQPWAPPQAVKNHQESFLKRPTIEATLKRPKQKQKVLHPSFYEEVLQGFVCLLRNWTAARQLHHVWNIIAFVCNCWMRCLMILRRAGYCCKPSTVGRWQKCVSKFKILAHLQEWRAFVPKTQFAVDSSQ